MGPGILAPSHPSPYRWRLGMLLARNAYSTLTLPFPSERRSLSLSTGLLLSFILSLAEFFPQHRELSMCAVRGLGRQHPPDLGCLLGELMSTRATCTSAESDSRCGGQLPPKILCVWLRLPGACCWLQMAIPESYRPSQGTGQYCLD